MKQKVEEESTTYTRNVGQEKLVDRSGRVKIGVDSCEPFERRTHVATEKRMKERRRTEEENKRRREEETKIRREEGKKKRRREEKKKRRKEEENKGRREEEKKRIRE